MRLNAILLIFTWACFHPLHAQVPAPAPPPSASNSLPKNWVACGPVYVNHYWGGGCDYADQTTTNTYAWASYSRTFQKGLPSSTSVGLAVKIASFPLGSATAYVMTVSSGGTTQTTSATTATFGQRFAFPVLWKSGWSITPILGGSTGAAQGFEVSIKAGYSW